jgi:hypothetical protein
MMNRFNGVALPEKSSYSYRASARCSARSQIENRFNGFYEEKPEKPLKRLQNLVGCSGTGLKPGVNEKTFQAKPLEVNA